jgi:hypothetical protein
LFAAAGFWPVGVNNMIAFMYPLVLLSLFLGPQVRQQQEQRSSNY